MTRTALLLSLLLIACADPAQQTKNEAPNTSASADAPTVVVPAGASSDQGVMGATPGPCGSTRVVDYAGRMFDEAMLEPIREQSGALRVRVYRPGGPPLPDEASDGRLLNLYLDEAGRIIMFDCS